MIKLYFLILMYLVNNFCFSFKYIKFPFNTIIITIKHICINLTCIFIFSCNFIFFHQTSQLIYIIDIHFLLTSTTTTLLTHFNNIFPFYLHNHFYFINTSLPLIILFHPYHPLITINPPI